MFNESLDGLKRKNFNFSFLIHFLVLKSQNKKKCRISRMRPETETGFSVQLYEQSNPQGWTAKQGNILMFLFTYLDHT